jgi:hypothetical protein
VRSAPSLRDSEARVREAGTEAGANRARTLLGR